MQTLETLVVLMLAILATLLAAGGLYADAIGSPDRQVIALFMASIVSASLAILTAHTATK